MSGGTLPFTRPYGEHLVRSFPFTPLNKLDDEDDDEDDDEVVVAPDDDNDELPFC